MLKNIISKNYNIHSGQDAWRQNLAIATLVADKIRSSFGPKGAYKMINYNRGPEQIVKITKDPLVVLEELTIQYPIAAIINEAAKIQRQELGDGVISFVIILSGLLRRAEQLMSKRVHPTIILQGFRSATKKSIEIINSEAEPWRGSIKDILEVVDCGRGFATPALCQMIKDASKILTIEGILKGERLQILKYPGGSINDTEFINGIILKKFRASPNMPEMIQKPRIAIISGKIGINRLEIKMNGEGHFPIVLNVNKPQIASDYKTEENKLKYTAVEHITQKGINFILCGQPIDDKIKGLLADHGILALESVDREELKESSEATGAQIVGSEKYLTEQDIGYAENVEQRQVHSEKVTAVHGCRGATFLLRGNTPTILDESEKIIRSSMTAIKIFREDARVIHGGGAIEMHVSRELEDYARDFQGKEQLAIEAFAHALEEIPTSLAENCGLNPIDLIAELKMHHSNGSYSYGLGVSGCSEEACLESAKIKISTVRRAYDVASLMLGIDQFIESKEIPKFHR
ncbi:MAG: hypothetical protein QG670_1017 [Thermoproteota archaeon]|nr:hypothetical protein [Thermoproteota archaeon]